MTGRIRDEAIRAVRERASMSEVISDVVALRRRGRSAVGLCRETFGLAGAIAGVLAAGARGQAVAQVLLEQHLVRPALAPVVGWAAVFVAIWVVAALLGRIAERLARALLLGGLDRGAGLLFGSAKGAAFLGFTLLLLEQALPASALSRVIAESRLGRPLEHMAGAVAQTGRELGIAPAGQRA